MISTIDLALDKCQRARLILKGYEIQKETSLIEKNDEELSIRMIAEYIDQAISSLSMQAPNLYHQHCIEEDPKAITETAITYNSFAERLKFALKEQGMTQGELTDWTGISQSTISSMATGKIKNIDTPRAEAIAKALSVNFVWLMHGEGDIYGSDFLTKVNEV